MSWSWTSGPLPAHIPEGPDAPWWRPPRPGGWDAPAPCPLKPPAGSHVFPLIGNGRSLTGVGAPGEQGYPPGSAGACAKRCVPARGQLPVAMGCRQAAEPTRLSLPGSGGCLLG